MTENKNEQLLDMFAAHALSALIQKIRFFDVEGQYGENISEDELQKVKKELTSSAYSYAAWMLIARQKQIDWLKENADKGFHFANTPTE